MNEGGRSKCSGRCFICFILYMYLSKRQLLPGIGDEEDQNQGRYHINHGEGPDLCDLQSHSQGDNAAHGLEVADHGLVEHGYQHTPQGEEHCTNAQMHIWGTAMAPTRYPLVAPKMIAVKKSMIALAIRME